MNLISYHGVEGCCPAFLQLTTFHFPLLYLPETHPSPNQPPDLHPNLAVFLYTCPKRTIGAKVFLISLISNLILHHAGRQETCYPHIYYACYFKIKFLIILLRLFNALFSTSERTRRTTCQNTR